MYFCEALKLCGAEALHSIQPVLHDAVTLRTEPAVGADGKPFEAVWAAYADDPGKGGRMAEYAAGIRIKKSVTARKNSHA